MIKKTVFFIIFFFFILNSFSQNPKENILANLFQLDSIVFNTSINNISNVQHEIKTCLSDKYIYYTNYSYNQENNVIYRTSIIDYHTDSIVYKLKNMKLISKKWLSNICSNDDFLIMDFQFQLIVFKIENNNLVYYKTLANGNTSSSELKIVNNKLFILKYYSPNENPYNTGIQVYNIDTWKLEKDYNIPINGVAFSRFKPNHWMDVSKHFMAITNPLNDELKILKHNGEVKQIINKNSNSWVSFDSLLFKSLNSVKLLDTMRKLNYNFISKTEGVWFISDSIILIRYYHYDSSKKNHNYFYDYYSLKDDKWRYDTTYSDNYIKFEPNTIISDKNMFILSWKYAHFFGNNKMIIFKNETNINPLNLTIQEFENKTEKYYEENNPIFSIFFYNIQE